MDIITLDIFGKNDKIVTERPSEKESRIEFQKFVGIGK